MVNTIIIPFEEIEFRRTLELSMKGIGDQLRDDRGYECR
jgi:hypothetical protein